MTTFWSSTANSNSDPQRPSIFPLVASSSLKNSLRPAVNHLTTYIAQTNPDNFFAQRLHHFSDEVFILLDLTLSKHFLKHFGGLFTENFYGLIRKDTSPQSRVSKSLLVHVLLPYLRLKVERLYEKWIITGENNPPSYLHHTVKVLQPLLTLGYYASNLILGLLYVGGQSRYHSILHQLDASELIHITPEVQEELDQRHRKLPFIQQNMQKLFSFGLELTAFSLQFIDYWYSREVTPTSITGNVAITSTPQAPKTDQNGQKGQSSDKCPLCRSPIQTPTLHSISGYVFCYRCIIEYLRGNGQCPLTGLPAHTGQLIRIFQQ